MIASVIGRAVLGRRMSWLVGLAAAMSLLTFGAAPASAILAKLPNGKYVGYQPIRGKAPKGSTAKSLSQFDSAFSNLDYSGGPVMPSSTNITIVWNPSNYGGHTPFQSDLVGGVNTFLQDLGHDSGGHSNADSVSTQYNDVNGNTSAYKVAYGGSYTVSDPLPSNGCPSSGGICLTDAQLQAELDHALATLGLPRDLTHEYYLLTPPDVVSCFDASATECSANADGVTEQPAFCAYHGTSSTPSPFIYSNDPDLAGNGGCDPFVIGGYSSYPNSSADGILSALSHEHNESITDPQPNNAWTDWQPGCTIFSPETCGGEIGDKCNFDEESDPNNVNTGGTVYNQVIDGRGYWLQPEWSNQTKQCLDGWTSNGHAASASFTTSPGAGTTVNFDASASSGSGGVAEYVWQFNDGPGQTNTVETTSPTTSHIFPGPGTYYVALTVMTGDGTSNGTAHAVTTSGASPPSSPTASFSYSPSSPNPGTAVSFDGSSSSDPNGVSIDQYTWNFGDGTIVYGGPDRTATHSYAATGSYSVTLTVRDSYGLSNSTAKTVTVTSPPPAPIGGGGGGGGGGSGGIAAVCKVPNVKGKTLAKARGALKAKGCAVGKLIKPKHKPKGSAGKHKKWALVVKSESPRIGSTKPKGTKVKLTLIWKKVRK